MGKVAGIRGAVSVEHNKKEDILFSTKLLLNRIVESNNIEVEDIVSVIFTATPDLDAVFPAEAARQLGWTQAALMDAAEIAVPGSMPQVIRVLIHVNVPENFRAIHVYMGECQKLRPDLLSGA